MTPRYAALVAAVLLLAGCGDRVGGGPDTGPYSPPGAHTLTVQTTIAPGRHGILYTEGAVPEIRLVTADGTTLVPRHDHRPTAVFVDLPPGRYRLEAALRPCDGNCGYLDAPATPCAGNVRIPVDGIVSVSWQVGRACRVVHLHER